MQTHCKHILTHQHVSDQFIDNLENYMVIIISSFYVLKKDGGGGWMLNLYPKPRDE